MATYFAHSINQVDRDGKDAGDCLAGVLANPDDKAAILQAIRDNLNVMNVMRDEAIETFRLSRDAKHAERVAALEASHTTALAAADQTAVVQQVVDDANAKLAAARATLDALAAERDAALLAWGSTEAGKLAILERELAARKARMADDQVVVVKVEEAIAEAKKPKVEEVVDVEAEK